jgi:hypothetical protein
MHGTLTRVFAAYPLAIPAVFMALAYLFPGHIGFDQSSQRVNVTFTLTELGAAVAAGYAMIAGIFAKWGIKR